jgi:uncharacterized protein YbgA (DUF1722 family)
VYNEHGMAQRNGTGMFPREVMRRFPLLPLEEEGRLNDMPLRENFLERVFGYYRWTKMLDEEPSPGGLVKFHTAHKLTLMAHSPKHYTEMGRLVADAGKRDWDELTAEYGAQLMEGLAVMGSRGKHVNVLQHLMGFLKNHLSSEDKQELLGLIEDYRQGLLPLIVPLTLLKHHLNRYPVPEWVLVPSAASGTPAGVPASVPQRADAAQSRVDLVWVTQHLEAFESGYGWLGLRDSVVCVQSYKPANPCRKWSIT